MKKIEVLMETYGYTVEEVCALIVKDANDKQFELDLSNAYNCKCGDTGICQCD